MIESCTTVRRSLGEGRRSHWASRIGEWLSEGGSYRWRTVGRGLDEGGNSHRDSSGRRSLAESGDRNWRTFGRFRSWRWTVALGRSLCGLAINSGSRLLLIFLVWIWLTRGGLAEAGIGCWGRGSDSIRGRSVCGCSFSFGFALIFDFGYEAAVTLYPIGDDLGATVRQKHTVGARHNLTVASLFMGVVIVGRLVFDSPREIIGHSLLVLQRHQSANINFFQSRQLHSLPLSDLLRTNFH